MGKCKSCINEITEKMEKLVKPTFSFDFSSNEEAVKKECVSKNRYSCKNCQGKQIFFLFLLS